MFSASQTRLKLILNGCSEDRVNMANKKGKGKTKAKGNSPKVTECFRSVSTNEISQLSAPFITESFRPRITAQLGLKRLLIAGTTVEARTSVPIYFWTTAEANGDGKMAEGLCCQG